VKVYASGVGVCVKNHFCARKLNIVVDLFCYREKESSDKGTQESIKVRETFTKNCLHSSSYEANGN